MASPFCFSMLKSADSSATLGSSAQDCAFGAACVSTTLPVFLQTFTQHLPSLYLLGSHAGSYTLTNPFDVDCVSIPGSDQLRFDAGSPHPRHRVGGEGTIPGCFRVPGHCSPSVHVFLDKQFDPVLLLLCSTSPFLINPLKSSPDFAAHALAFPSFKSDLEAFS